VETNRKSALVAVQVTTRSPMGAIIYETGGILVDHGWIRILGSGCEPSEETSVATGDGKWENDRFPFPGLFPKVSAMATRLVFLAVVCVGSVAFGQEQGHSSNGLTGSVTILDEKVDGTFAPVATRYDGAIAPIAATASKTPLPVPTPVPVSPEPPTPAPLLSELRPAASEPISKTAAPVTPAPRNYHLTVPPGSTITVSSQVTAMEPGSYIITVPGSPASKPLGYKTPPGNPYTDDYTNPFSGSTTPAPYVTTSPDAVPAPPEAMPAPVALAGGGSIVPPVAKSAPVFMPSTVATPAPKAATPEPMGFTMDFHMGGNFDASFEMNVTQGQAKQKASVAKKRKTDAAKKPQSFLLPVPQGTAPSGSAVPPSNYGSYGDRSPSPR